MAQAFCSKSADFGSFGIRPYIFANNPESSCKSICKHIGGVPGSLERFPAALTQIRHLQNHGLLPRLFAQNRPISGPSEFTPNPIEQSRKQLEIHFEAYRRRFREFGAISGTYQNAPSSKPWSTAQGFCLKSAKSGPLRIHFKSSPTIPKVVEIHLQAHPQTRGDLGESIRSTTAFVVISSRFAFCFVVVVLFFLRLRICRPKSAHSDPSTWSSPWHLICVDGINERESLVRAVGT